MWPPALVWGAFLSLFQAGAFDEPVIAFAQHLSRAERRDVQLEVVQTWERDGRLYVRFRHGVERYVSEADGAGENTAVRYITLMAVNQNDERSGPLDAWAEAAS